MSHPSVARSLVLETTLFPEDVSLDRLQALLDQWEGCLLYTSDAADD